MLIAAFIIAIISLFIALVSVSYAMTLRSQTQDFIKNQIIINKASSNSLMYLLQKDGVFNGANGSTPVITSQVGQA